MPSQKLSLLSLVKYTKNELLLESMLQAKGEHRYRILERYNKKGRSLKLKVLITKIIYAVIFGILPIMPLLTYFQIIENLAESPVSIESIIFLGSILFTLYFTLQFFNFFLMGLLESGMIMSGIIFRWFETLPISRDKLRKVAYLTIFRSFDIPMIVIVLGFPITILIGTQNILIFLVALGISLVNIFFSFNLLIIFGARLSRVLDFNRGSSKRSLLIRLFHILSYLIVILGSIYIIQWVFNSLEEIFRLIIELEYPSTVNLILSIIPYPFNPSYLFSNIITINQGSLESWVSIFIGLGLFIILMWWSHLKASKTLKKIANPKLRKNRKEHRSELVENKINISITTRSPIKAYLHKDLSAASHDLKTLLSMIMPIILSCIFSFSFNIVNMSVAIILERDLFYNWVGILLVSPAISSMLVYGVLNIDISGKSIMASLPINPREQAIAKLKLLIILQTLAVFAPLLIYIGTIKFLLLFFTVLLTLPTVWIFLVLTFELRVLYFGKFKNYYVVDEVNPENRFFKWILIVCILYIISFWQISVLISFYLYQGFLYSLTFSFFVVDLIGFIIVSAIFENTFPVFPAFKKTSIIQTDFPYLPKYVPLYGKLIRFPSAEKAHIIKKMSKNPDIYSDKIKEKIDLGKLLMRLKKFDESIDVFQNALILVKEKHNILPDSIRNRFDEINEIRKINSLIRTCSEDVKK
ncbi:MAG: hypothetical protein ACXAB8_16940 [Promethearchaeota archaeon]